MLVTMTDKELYRLCIIQGELVQIDGFHRNWFVSRGPKCCLLVFIYDAIGRLMQ